ncbi:hypothetical protein AcW1_001705 [Taiwanofungus camphoratus]|nr:hypothetical protein AcV7_001564 [Antrodia cinnamomea]KAI0945493.1 hypothetical protein AcW1_001705 [Antrodia cinnamomea]
MNDADVIELKFFILRPKIPEVMNLGQRAIQRNPNQPDAYYALSLAATKGYGVQCIKELKSIAFVRNHIL